MKRSSFLARLRMAAIDVALLISTRAQGQITVDAISTGQQDALKVISTLQNAETGFASEWLPEKRRFKVYREDGHRAKMTGQGLLGFEPAPYHNDFNGFQFDPSCNKETKSKLSDIIEYLREAVAAFGYLLDDNDKTGEPYVYDFIPFVEMSTIGQIVNDMLQIINGEGNTIPILCATANSDYCTIKTIPNAPDPTENFYQHRRKDGGDSLVVCPSTISTVEFDTCSDLDYFHRRKFTYLWVKFLAILSFRNYPFKTNESYSRPQEDALAIHIAKWVHTVWYVSNKKAYCPDEVDHTDPRRLLSLSERIVEAKSAICGNRCRTNRDCDTALTGCRCHLSLSSTSLGDNGGDSSSAAMARRCLPS